MVSVRPPPPTTSFTPGTRANDAATRVGEARQAATMSMSRMTSRRRRTEPATSAASTSGCLRTLATSRPASARACGKSTSAPVSRRLLQLLQRLDAQPLVDLVDLCRAEPGDAHHLEQPLGRALAQQLQVL